MPVATIPEALEDIRQGKMVILVDDEDRENEGDLCVAAEKVTPEIINFMARYGRGLICLSLTSDWVERLRLPMMVTQNKSRFETAFTVSVEARAGVTTGISAADRSHTIRTAIADQRQTRGPRQPRTCVPSSGQEGRGTFPDGTDGGFRGSRQACRVEACRCHL